MYSKSFQSQQTQNDIELSKLMSWILRHGANEESLQIDADGFIDVDEMLKHKRFISKRYSLVDIKRVVANDLKRRFTLDSLPNRKNRIKANQGHSMANVQMTMKNISDPSECPIAIHGTYHRFWKQIKAEGLKRMTRNHIHLTGHEHFNSEISGFRSNCEILIYINVRKAMADGILFYRSDNDVILTEGVNANFIIASTMAASAIKNTSTPDLNSSTNETKSTMNETKKNQQSIKQNKRRQKKRKLPPTDQLQEDVCRVLQNCEEGTELKALTYTLQPESEFMECIFEKIVLDINRVLSQIFKQFEIHPFGSSVCGMAFKSSDFDIYVDIKDLPDKSKKTISKTIFQTIDSMKRLNVFEQTIAIVHAKIPLLKCVHVKTGFSCDFSFTSPMGRYNSQIIRHIIYFDYRIHPLILILKHWMKTRNLLGTGKITSYCLIMMVIYYLQTVKIIKPLAVYQTQVPKFIVDKYWNLAWNTSFPCKQNVCPDLTVSRLLCGFVDFYKNFDFNTYIICPLYGETYERAKFEKKIPAEFDAYIEYMKSDGATALNLSCPMCIQDPFALNHNVASSCRSVFRFLKLELVHASDIFRKQLKPGVKSSQFLYKFFTEFAMDPEPNSNVVSSNTSKANDLQITILPLEFELSVIRRTMMDDNRSAPIEINEVKKRWSQLTTKLIRFIFEQLFKLNVTPINVEDSTNERLKKYQKLNDQKDVSDTSDLVHWNVSGTEDVYHMKKLTKATSTTYFIDEATYATNKLMQLSALKKHSIELNCLVSVSSSPMDVHVSFNENKQSKKNATKFFYQNFARSIRNHMKAYFLHCQRVSFVEPEALLEACENEVKVANNGVKEQVTIESVKDEIEKVQEEIENAEEKEENEEANVK